MKIVIQGDKGSNHHLISKKLFAETDIELLCAKTFRELAESLAEGQADLAVMAIENTIAGSILGNYDLLTKYKLKVIGEGYLRIQHCLIGLPGTKSADIKSVHSHEMALKQCEEYLVENRMEAREYYDTAAAVEHIKNLNKKSEAAIAPALAAEIHGMEVVKAGIETDKKNYTRFVILKRNDDKKDYQGVLAINNNRDLKTMIEFKLTNETGSLVKTLQILAAADFNLSKIESRPIISENWHYRFYVDFLSSHSRQDIEHNLTLLKNAVEYYEILGIFPPGITYEP